MALKPVWIDSLIDDGVASQDPKKIAKALMESPRMLEAIQKGLEAANNLQPGVIGPTRTQKVRQAIVAALTADV